MEQCARRREHMSMNIEQFFELYSPELSFAIRICVYVMFHLIFKQHQKQYNCVMKWLLNMELEDEGDNVEIYTMYIYHISTHTNY